MRNWHYGSNYTNTYVAMVRACLPHTIQLHNQNSPLMDTSGQEREGMTKRDMATQHGKRPKYQGTDSWHGPQSSSRPSQMRNHCCRLTCLTMQRGWVSYRYSEYWLLISSKILHHVVFLFVSIFHHFHRCCVKHTLGWLKFLSWNSSRNSSSPVFY